MADEWRMAAKSVRPLPVAHKELAEETRIRQRYVDLILRPQAMETVRTRAGVVRSLRESFHGRGFLEVETPMLQTLQGGATARPFVTHSNALGIDLFLRIAPELYLKRCVVGGIEKVFEINRNFRNEGSDSSHSPEFAMLEFYQAYGTYDSMAVLTRQLIQEAAQAVLGTQVVTLADGGEYDLSGEWTSADHVRVAVRGAGRGDHPADPGRAAAQARRRARAGGGPEARATESSSRNCGSTWSATTCTRRHSCAISRWRPRR